MPLLRQKSAEGGRAALAAFGVPSQPGFKSVGIKLPKAGDLPSLPPPSLPKTLGQGGIDSVGELAAKIAFNVGMGASQSTSGTGAKAGVPVDTGRRQRSVIDRTFQANDDNFATSSMPLPGDVVAP